MSLLACGLGVLGTGAAQAAPGAAHGLPPIHVIDLHRAYLRALGHVTSSPVRGVVRPAGYRPRARARAAGAIPAGCAEPNCKLTYNGGPVQHHPRVYLLLWGPNWQSQVDAAQAATATYLEKFYAGLGVEAPNASSGTTSDLWSEIMAQYPDKTGGFPTFGGTVLAGAWNDTNTPPTGATQSDFAAEAQAFASQHGLSSDLTDDQIVIATQSNTCPNGFSDLNCGSNFGDYCAWHASIRSGTYRGLTYTNLPYQIDSSGCSPSLPANGTNTQYNGFTISGGHEYAETATDPLGNGWIDLPDSSGGEIGDKCAWTYPTTATSDFGLVTLSTGTFVMQPLFSNRTFGTPKQSCPMKAVPDTLTIVQKSYTSVVDTFVKVQVKVASSTGAALNITPVTGLPAGLTMTPAGLVTGTPTTSTGSSPSKVRLFVDDTRGAHEVAYVTWAVTSPSGLLKGYKGLCADVSGTSTASGTKVVINACSATTQEKWTLASGGHVMADGKCLTDPKSAGPGAGLVIATCSTSASQQWARNSKGQYVMGMNHLCLADPNSSVKAGTQLRLEACLNSASEVWSIP